VPPSGTQKNPYRAGQTPSSRLKTHSLSRTQREHKNGLGSPGGGWWGTPPRQVGARGLCPGGLGCWGPLGGGGWGGGGWSCGGAHRPPSRPNCGPSMTPTPFPLGGFFCFLVVVFPLFALFNCFSPLLPMGGGGVNLGVFYRFPRLMWGDYVSGWASWGIVGFFCVLAFDRAILPHPPQPPFWCIIPSTTPARRAETIKTPGWVTENPRHKRKQNKVED